MSSSDLNGRGRARHREGLTIIETVLGRGQKSILGLYLYTAVSKMLDGVRRSPRLRKISPHLIGTPSILLVRPRISQSELAGFLGCTRATAGKQVAECVRSGWISRSRSTIDRRSYVLELTHSGRERLDEVANIVIEHEDQMSPGLTSKEREMLRLLLLKFIVG